ncbi:regulatory protein GemA [Sphingomonas sp. CCH15-F11]|uniref:regulatory protein GemA n=1 Tax=Sphingomonas sp. CCH15-F11 TaxID=1768785 RepID=UPI0009E6F2E3|nr:regulatory protein GemA [Sphingomonas sp. CCH15-F11]
MADPARKQPRSAAPRTDSAKREVQVKMIRAVRAACRRRGMDDDDRKAFQQREIGRASLSDMSIAELGKLLDLLNKDRAAPMAHRPHVAKIKALWWTLYWLGEIDEPGDRQLDAFVKRQTGVNALRFLDHRQAASVIEALKSWATRAGVTWPPAQPGSDAQGERRAVIDALVIRLLDRGDPVGNWAYCQSRLGLDANPASWTPQQLDACIKLLGRRYRALLTE